MSQVPVTVNQLLHPRLPEHMLGIADGSPSQLEGPRQGKAFKKHLPVPGDRVGIGLPPFVSGLDEIGIPCQGKVHFLSLWGFSRCPGKGVRRVRPPIIPGTRRDRWTGPGGSRSGSPGIKSEFPAPKSTKGQRWETTGRRAASVKYPRLGARGFLAQQGMAETMPRP